MSRRMSLLTDSVLTLYAHSAIFRASQGEESRETASSIFKELVGKDSGCLFDTFRNAYEKFCDSALELKTPAGKVRGTYYVKPGFEKKFRANVEAFKRGEAEEGTRKPRAEAGVKSRPRGSEREAGPSSSRREQRGTKRGAGRSADQTSRAPSAKKPAQVSMHASSMQHLSPVKFGSSWWVRSSFQFSLSLCSRRAQQGAAGVLLSRSSRLFRRL